MKKGSLTVFLSLSLSILISFSLFVTEIAIGNSQRIRFETAADMAMDSVMGEYSVALKERYGLLYIDTSYLKGEAEAVRVTDRFRVYFNANTVKVYEKKHAPWGNLSLQEAVLTSFETAAAQGGKSMQSQMIHDMEQHPENGTEIAAAKEAVSAFAMQESSNALEAFCAVMEQIAGMELPVLEKEDGTEEEVALGNPADWVYGMIGSDVIFLCDVDMSGMTTMQMNTDGLVSHRGMRNMQSSNRIFSGDDDLFYAYLLTRMGNYGRIREESALGAQLEYLLAGKNSDFENVRATVAEIFTIRMGDNVRLAMEDGGLYEAAAGVADALLAVQLCEAFREPVIQSILYACAFLESVSDVNSLLHGGRVPLRKDSHSMSVSYVTDGSLYYGGSQEGLSYSQFLIGMLSSKEERTVLARTMDVLEMDIRQMTGNGQFCMDQCVERMTIRVSAQGGLGKQYETERVYGYY